jgi:hypothetical protein
MIEKQNVTLSVPEDLVRRAQILAIDHGKVLSGLIVELLTEFVEQHEQYAVAKRKHLALLAEDIDMGTNGRANWVRESLHK